jgi:hypothetical protein
MPATTVIVEPPKGCIFSYFRTGRKDHAVGLYRAGCGVLISNTEVEMLDGQEEHGWLCRSISGSVDRIGTARLPREQQ